MYRAVDRVGRTVDFYLSERRNVNAAKHFFRQGMKLVDYAAMLPLLLALTRSIETGAQNRAAAGRIDDSFRGSLRSSTGHADFNVGCDLFGQNVLFLPTQGRGDGGNRTVLAAATSPSIASDHSGVPEPVSAIQPDIFRLPMTLVKIQARTVNQTEQF